MKRLFLVMTLIVCTVFCLTGCSGVSQEEYDVVVAERDALRSQLENIGIDTSVAPVPEASADTTQGNSDKFDESLVLEQISVEEFAYNPRGWYYAFLILKNNSAFDISISVDVDFFDAAGNLVGTKSYDQEAFGAGAETIMYFMPDEEFESIEYELRASEEDWYECVISDLSYETTDAKNKIILSVTNNGDEPAEFVEGSVLFFKDNAVVGFSQNYFTDDDSEIKPGSTIKNEMDCYEEFDAIRVFLTGRR